MNYNDPAYDVILKTWGGCAKSKDGRHWAYYAFRTGVEKKFWLQERVDKKHNCWWRHYEFMSLPCSRCGAYSPPRCCNMFSSGLEAAEKSCTKEKIVDHRPGNALPDSIRRYKENGWTYYFFVETLSDSLCNQETFRLKEMPPCDE